MVQTELRWLDMLLSEGALDILTYLKVNRVGQFTDFLKIRNKRTGNKFSPSTISARLDNLEQMQAIITTAIKTKRRRVLGYQVTEKGVEILETAYAFEKKLSQIIGSETKYKFREP